INETICLNGCQISDEDIEKIFFIIQIAEIKCNIKLSQFELLTVIMFYYFKQCSIDFLVLEVGMGGKNDATNVIKQPICAVITNISLEHTQWFGNSLYDIAAEKSGIIKNCPVIIADNSQELYAAVCGRATEVINILHKYNINTSLKFDNFTTNLSFTYKSDCTHHQYNYNLSLFGKFQALNFLCAYEVFNLLKISDSSIKHSAESTLWAGRLEQLSRNPSILLDATHNEAGAKALYETLSGHYNPSDVVIVTSILADKNIRGMLDYFKKIAQPIIFTSINCTNRGMDANTLYNIATDNLQDSDKIRFYNVDSPLEALFYAKSLNKKLIIITGSLYLLKQITAI
ncbi:MAG: hypothetical protein K2P99_00555, partial [Burkholderiales bacterium]|nr:hypothetical protein [Burkholderiales bacterium]